ncbi:MAG: peptidoglycan-binding protein [Parabacteroides sp.]|nr:peptidoglycan-binding protein [Parabacteroides sp.]
MIEKLINKAISYLGAKEPTGDDQFIRYYNSIAGTSFSMTVAWCAIFVTSIARMIGISTDLIPTFASCDLGKKWFTDKGRYEKSKAYGGTYVPKRGDVVFYSGKYKQNDSTHVGYVVSVSGGSLKAIEGNKSDAVGYRNLSLANVYIIGYGRVADFVGGSSSSGSSGSSSKSPMTTVSAFQEWLNANFGEQIKACKLCGNALLKVDGSYGAKTQAGAVIAFQVTCNSSFGCKLIVDGDFGSKSKAYGNKALVKKGSKGTFVYIVEGVLASFGFYSGEFDGVAGNGVDAGIRAFQTKYGLTVDGENGANSYYKELNLKG